MKNEIRLQHPADSRVYAGLIKLLVMPPVDYAGMKRLEGYLYEIPDLRIILSGGKTREGGFFLVVVRRPIPLLDFMRIIPLIKQVTGGGREIEIVLKQKGRMPALTRYRSLT